MLGNILLFVKTANRKNIFVAMLLTTETTRSPCIVYQRLNGVASMNTDNSPFPSNLILLNVFFLF